MKPHRLVRNLIAQFNRQLPWIHDVVLLFTRITIGWQFFLTGKGKLANLERTAGFFESLGIPAPGFQAAMVGGVEMVGGLLLLAGLLTRPAALLLTFTMIVAYLTAHREDAFQGVGAFADEAPYAFLLGSLVLLAFGPGRVAADRFLKPASVPSSSTHGPTGRFP